MLWVCFFVCMFCLCAYVVFVVFWLVAYSVDFFGLFFIVFFFKQKTAYEMRISDWSSDVCSSDLARQHVPQPIDTRFEGALDASPHVAEERLHLRQIGRASCRERVCKYV